MLQKAILGTQNTCIMFIMTNFKGSLKLYKKWLWKVSTIRNTIVGFSFCKYAIYRTLCCSTKSQMHFNFHGTFLLLILVNLSGKML